MVANTSDPISSPTGPSKIDGDKGKGMNKDCPRDCPRAATSVVKENRNMMQCSPITLGSSRYGKVVVAGWMPDGQGAL